MKSIAKSHIKDLLALSSQHLNVFVPAVSDQGDALFTQLPKSPGELDNVLNKVSLDDLWVVIPPKDIFFPQQEDMLHFTKNGITAQIESTKKLIFGIRSCDLKGLLFSDAFFRRAFDDIYYLSRAQDRLIVVIGCRHPPRPESCFCTSTKTGPFAESGYDLQLVDIGDVYLIEVGSKQGQDYLEMYPQLFSEVNSQEMALAETVKREASENIELKVDFDKALEIMKHDYNFEENFKRIAERCLYCGACLYTCPTCTCFNVFDENNGVDGVRRRNWDGCVYAGYTREASGHNPRTEKWVRTARRYEHKLKYDCMVAAESGCVGCGRCLSSCPVNIGMSKFIQEITENKRTM